MIGTSIIGLQAVPRASAIARSPTATFEIRAMRNRTLPFRAFFDSGATMSFTIPIDALDRQPSADDMTTASIAVMTRHRIAPEDISYDKFA